TANAEKERKRGHWEPHADHHSARDRACRPNWHLFLFHHIAQAAQRPDRRSVRLQLLAKTCDVNLNGIWRDGFVVTKDFSCQAFFRYDLADARYESFEHDPLASPQIDIATAHPRHVVRPIEMELPHHNDRCRIDLWPSQQGANTRGEFTWFE